MLCWHSTCAMYVNIHVLACIYNTYLYNSPIYICTVYIHVHVCGIIMEFPFTTNLTSILQVSKGHHEHAFYSLPEFEHWCSTTENSHTWKVKYYKGLGTSTAKEAKEYFSDMERHRIPFKYSGAEDDDAILLVSRFW